MSAGKYSGGLYGGSSNAGSATMWGTIIGLLSDQTDLQTALNAKENLITAGTTTQYLRGDKTFQSIPWGIFTGTVTNQTDLQGLNIGTYTAANSALPIATSDTLNVAVNKLQNQISSVQGGFTYAAPTAITANTNLTFTNSFLIIQATTADIALTLPQISSFATIAPNAKGFIYTIVFLSQTDSTKTATINPFAGDTILNTNSGTGYAIKLNEVVTLTLVIAGANSVWVRTP